MSDTDPTTLEDAILSELARRCGIRFGELHLSVWDGELVEVADRSFGSRGGNLTTLRTLDDVLGDVGFQNAAAELARLYQTTRCVIVVKIQDRAFQRVNVHRAAEAGDEAMEAKRAQLRARVAGFR